jgi:hypothetical protein
MSKISLLNVSGGYSAVDTINTNFTRVRDFLDSLVSRDGTAPNAMTATLDMNSQRVVNLPDADSASEPVTKRQLDAYANASLGVYDAAAGTYTASGSGAVQRTIAGKLASVVSVNDYDVPGASNWTQAIQEAHDALPATGGVILFEKGIEYVVNGTVTISKPCVLQGFGAGHGSGSVATISTTSATADIFNVTTNSGVAFRDLAFRGAVVRSGGAYDIKISGNGSDANMRTRVENCYFYGSYNAIGFIRARFWVVRDCVFDEPINYAIYYPNASDVDEADNYVTGCVFKMSSACFAGVYFESAAATWIVGNKFFSGKYGVWWNLKGVTGTLQIVANSFEEQINAHILVQQGTVGQTGGNININCNEFSNLAVVPTNPTVYIAAGAAQYLSNISISDNVFNHSYNANLNAISVLDGNGVVIHGNIIDLYSNALPGGITTGGNATNVLVADNVFNRCTTAQKYKNGLNASTVLRDHMSTGLQAADLGAWANGSMVYVTNGTFGSNPLTSGGTGAFARRINGAWVGT